MASWGAGDGCRWEVIGTDGRHIHGFMMAMVIGYRLYDDYMMVM